ncbi:hypothetical protein ACPA9J_19485 [Pseudomonas aeruginosa]
MGQDQRFAHLKDPQTAYRQLLGVLGHPRVFVHRLEDWRKLAPAAHRSVLQEAERGRQAVSRTALSCIDPKLQALEANDWAVVLSSPLLAMFEKWPEGVPPGGPGVSQRLADRSGHPVRRQALPSGSPRAPPSSSLAVGCCQRALRAAGQPADSAVVSSGPL